MKVLKWFTWGYSVGSHYRLLPWSRSLGDFNLSAEQLEAQAIGKEEKRTQMKSGNATNWHYKQMATNYDGYIGQATERVQRSRANHPGRDANHQARRIEQAKAEKTFYCVLCDIPCGTKQNLEKYQKRAKHPRKLQRRTTPPFKCRPCNVAFHNQSNLTRHEETQRHRQNVSAAQPSPSVR
jgi:hypothetical protein